ncbi:MAG: MBL fold metallo-hydrolase, partial [Rhodospirillaceae bacterium]|nr:MBL fold metallo-hydrolase [Rhodospirillaceae bacterium]
MKITVLGCGSSSGTPSVEWGWGKCDPENPKNNRLRPSILVEDSGKSVLVDTSPDLRRQLLDFNIKSLDGVLLTHAHSDHLHGIDDIRAINRLINGPLTLFSSKETLETVAQRFAYVFEPLSEGAAFYYKATLEGQAVAPGNSFNVGGITSGINVMPIGQDHGFMDTLGFRFGDFAYST